MNNDMHNAVACPVVELGPRFTGALTWPLNILWPPQVGQALHRLPGKSPSCPWKQCDFEAYFFLNVSGSGISIEGIVWSESAGINRHIVGDARALRKRRSDSILASSLACDLARDHSEA
jgi:hypothetical protein